jgi:NADH-quinone oxidoreductase subunit G
MPTITIDDKQISVPNGTLIVQAARQLGIEIPVFCYHSRLASVGMCRMCLVEVGTPRMGPDRKPVLKPDGLPEIAFMPKPQTACTMTVSEGMVVRAAVPSVQEARRGIVEFLLTSHPLDCPICDKGGECTLQEETLTYGPGASRFVYNDKFRNEKNVPLGPLIRLDRERCVQCARCIRFQDEIADDRVLGFSDRGRGMEIITFSDPPFDSKFSGNTTDICPVGALTTTDFRFQARPWELSYTQTVCPHCAVGCNLTLSVRNQADIKRVLPRTNAAVNDIWICDKGRFGHHFADDSAGRLSTPLIRKDGQLVPATWDEAIALAAEKLGAFKTQDAQSIAGVMGDRVSNEDMYLFGKFFKEVLRSDNLRSVGSPIDLNAAVGLAANSDLPKLGKGNAVFVIGSDVEEEAPVAFLRLRQAKESGAALIVAHGRPTKLDRSGTSLRYRYGSEGQLLAGLLNVITAENLVNADFVASRTMGFDDLKAAVQAYDPDTVAARTGLSADAIRSAARVIAQAKDAVFVYGRELPDTAASLLQALVLVTGHAGRPNNGVLPILAHNNTQGVRALMPRHTAAKPRALVVLGAAVERDGAEFMLVQDLFLTPTARQADVVLPAQSWAERDGTYTNYERRVQHFEPGVMPVGESKPDWQILALLANELDQMWNYSGASAVFSELASTVPVFGGMSYAKLSGKLIRTRAHFLYEGTSYESAGGQGMVYPSTAESADTKFTLSFSEPAMPLTAALTLVGSRVLFDAGTLISETALLREVTPASYADLNRADAERLHIHDGEAIRLTTANGTLDVTARVDGRAPVGVVVAPINLQPSDIRCLLARGQVTALVTVEKAAS